LDPIQWDSNPHDQSEEIDPLEQLFHQQQSKNNKKARRPKFLRREILIEWKKAYQEKSMKMYVLEDIYISTFIFHNLMYHNLYKV